MKSIVIYSRNFCPYCDMAKELITVKGYKFEEKSADEYLDEFTQYAIQYNHRTVPMIFIGETFIGGFDQLKALHDKDELDTMVNG